MKAKGAECQTPYTKSVNHVSAGDALSDRFGSSNRICSVAPITPWASIIQNNTSDPISGVTIIGSSEKKIVGPRNSRGSPLTPSAIASPKTSTKGVTIKVNESVKAKAL